MQTNEQEKQLEVLTERFNQSLNALYKPGSKREARKEETEQLREDARKAGASEEEIKNIKVKSPSCIVYDDTLKGYKSICARFAKWLVENHQEVTKPKYAHKMGYDAEWLKLFPNASTRKTYRAALAKAYRCNGQDICDTPKRGMPTKGRDYHPDASFEAQRLEDEDLTLLSRFTGARKREILNVKPSCFKFHGDGKLYCHFTGREQRTKQLRNRVSVVPLKHVDKCLEILDRYVPDENMFTQLPNGWNEHALRRLYAADVYEMYCRPLVELENKRIPIKPKRDNRRGTVRTSAPAIRESNLCGATRFYDRHALQQVAMSLGHGAQREDLVVKNYGDYLKLEQN